MGYVHSPFAQSGVAGLIYVVIPNVMSIAVFSPPLDSRGNSVRGIDFCRRLIKRHNYGVFDQLGDFRKINDSENGDGDEKQEQNANSIPILRSQSSNGSAGFSRKASSHAISIKMHTFDLWRKAIRKIVNLHRSYNALLPHEKDEIPLDAIHALLNSNGINCKEPCVAALLKKMHNDTGFIRFRDLFVDQANEENVVVKCLMGSLVLPDFRDFCFNLFKIFEQIRDTSIEDYYVGQSESKRNAYIGRRIEEDEEPFAVSICTVDGQQMGCGDFNVAFPIMEVFKPLFYACAIELNGVEKVREMVGIEPTSFDPCSFNLSRSGNKNKPYNPFMDSGALVVCSMLSQFSDSSSRFNHLINQLRVAAGSRKITFSQTAFLAMKQKNLRVRAISQFIKGMGCYPENTDPDDATNVFRQGCAIEMDCEKLAIVASTIANSGICPLTGQRWLSCNTIPELLAQLYSCGMNQFSGAWNFTVGIPAKHGQSGCLMVVVPGVMGMALYSPVVNNCGVSVRGFELLRCLTKQYRINLFDQLVFGDEEILIDEEMARHGKKSSEADRVDELAKALAFFELCNAAGLGDIDGAIACIARGAKVNNADYDGRTPLHIACSDGQEAMVELLLENGANPLAKDRWGSTPLDDARRHEFAEIISFIEHFIATRPLVVSINPTPIAPNSPTIQKNSSRTSRRTSEPNIGGVVGVPKVSQAAENKIQGSYITSAESSTTPLSTSFSGEQVPGESKQESPKPLTRKKSITNRGRQRTLLDTNTQNGNQVKAPPNPVTENSTVEEQKGNDKVELHSDSDKVHTQSIDSKPRVSAKSSADDSNQLEKDPKF